MKHLALLPQPGEAGAEQTSYDRTSYYDPNTDSYVGWGANNDYSKFITSVWEGEMSGANRLTKNLVVDIKGPGVIWRVWSADNPTNKTYFCIDGDTYDNPTFTLNSFSDMFSGTHSFYNFPALSYQTEARGNNCYQPITFNESIQIWVDVPNPNSTFYNIVNYTQLPEGSTVEKTTGVLSNESRAALERVNNFFTGNLGGNPNDLSGEIKGVDNTFSVPAGGGATVLDVAGEGAIAQFKIKPDARIRTTMNKSAAMQYLRELTVSMYWDGEDKPSVWAPLCDFFGDPTGDEEYYSLPMGYNGEEFYCYMVMPFASGAKIVIGNDGTAAKNVGVDISVVPLKGDADGYARFHAKWHRGFYAERADQEADYNVLRVNGAGRFMGFSLHVYQNSTGYDYTVGRGNENWWGEGDEKFFVDGEKFPSSFGTGSEDYFGYAYCRPEKFYRPYHAQPLFAENFGVAQPRGTGHKSNVRYQINDNVPFFESFDGYIEKYYTNFASYGITSYFYLDADGEDAYAPQSLEARTNYYRPKAEAAEVDELNEVGFSTYNSNVINGIAPAVEGNDDEPPVSPAAKDYTYSDIVDQMLDMEYLALLPTIGEAGAEQTSYDRNSTYNPDTDTYWGWNANKDHSEYRQNRWERGTIVSGNQNISMIADIKGPGVIWRIYSAQATVNRQIWFCVDDDTLEHPTYVMANFRDMFSGTHEFFNYPALSYTSAQGQNCYQPITFNKSIKIYVLNLQNSNINYHINYTQLPAGSTVESTTFVLSDEDKEALERVNDFFSENLGENPNDLSDEIQGVDKTFNVPAGGSATVLDVAGEGAVAQFKITPDARIRARMNKSAAMKYLKELTVSMYWDGEDTPSVWAPLCDFFGDPTGDEEYQSLPMGYDGESFYCYMVMPFAEGAKIVIGNDGIGDKNVGVDISVVPLEGDADGYARFHAKWHRGFYAERQDRWPDYNVLRVSGAGRFLGFSLHAYQNETRYDYKPGYGYQTNWWGEGDEKFFVDGQKYPSSFGTGMDGYFGYGAANREAFARPYHAQPLRAEAITTGDSLQGTGHKSNVRYQLNDNVPFFESFDGYIEKIFQNYAEYGITAYFYLDANGEDTYAPQSLDARTNYYGPKGDEPESNEDEYSYVDIVNQMLDMEHLALLPQDGEKGAEWTSTDRRSQYDAETDTYTNWTANSDMNGYIERVGTTDRYLIADMEGPGVIWRIWTADSKQGIIEFCIDGDTYEAPTISRNFSELFFGTAADFDYPELCYRPGKDTQRIGSTGALTTDTSGRNCFVPITYNKSCKVYLRNIGVPMNCYYMVNYTTLPKGSAVESLTGTFTDEHKAALRNVNDYFAKQMGENPNDLTGGVSFAGGVEVKAGGTATAVDYDGEGAIAGFKVKLTDDIGYREFYDALQALTVSMYWDGEDSPSVWAPLGNFFGTPFGDYYTALPMGMRRDEWFYCYFYMPFATGAKIVIGNEGTKDYNLAVDVAIVPLKKSIELYTRFHAKWHRGSYQGRADRPTDYSVLYTEGQGRFLGFMQHVYEKGNYGWWGEGDEKFFVDGEKFPSSIGTGSEDYFGYAWCSPAVINERAFHAQPRRDGAYGNIGNAINLRFQLGDNVPFFSSFDGYIEKTHADSQVEYSEMPYWYLSVDGVDNYKPVPLAQRTSFFVQPPISTGVRMEAEDAAVINFEATAGSPAITELSGASGYNQEVVAWENTEQSGEISFTFDVYRTLEYVLKLQGVYGPAYGVYQFAIDGKDIGAPVDFYNSKNTSSLHITMGSIQLGQGTHTLSARPVGKNDLSGGYSFALDNITLATPTDAKKLEFEDMTFKSLTGNGIFDVRDYRYRHINSSSTCTFSRDQIWWTGGAIGDEIVLDFTLPEAAKLNTLGIVGANGFGQFQLYIDGETVDGTVDGRSSGGIDSLSRSLGDFILAAGDHELKAVITGKQGAAAAYYVGLDYIEYEKAYLTVAPGQAPSFVIRKNMITQLKMATNTNSLTFTSSNPVIATVTQAGVITGKSIGVAVIQVKDTKTGLVFNVVVNVSN